MHLAGVIVLMVSAGYQSQKIGVVSGDFHHGKVMGPVWVVSEHDGVLLVNLKRVPAKKTEYTHKRLTFSNMVGEHKGPCERCPPKGPQFNSYQRGPENTKGDCKKGGEKVIVGAENKGRYWPWTSKARPQAAREGLERVAPPSTAEKGEMSGDFRDIAHSSFQKWKDQRIKRHSSLRPFWKRLQTVRFLGGRLQQIPN